MMASVLRSEWVDLSGAELRARLRQRGVNETVVHRLVDGRDNVYEASVITRFLSEGAR